MASRMLKKRWIITMKRLPTDLVTKRQDQPGFFSLIDNGSITIIGANDGRGALQPYNP